MLTLWKATEAVRTNLRRTASTLSLLVRPRKHDNDVEYLLQMPEQDVD